jgi:hypothetical protein
MTEQDAVLDLECVVKTEQQCREKHYLCVEALKR